MRTGSSSGCGPIGSGRPAAQPPVQTAKARGSLAGLMTGVKVGSIPQVRGAGFAGDVVGAPWARYPVGFRARARWSASGYMGRANGENVPPALLEAFLALRASYFVYRNAHWQVRGQNAYGNHLLFERLYNETATVIDNMAEAMVGSFGVDVIDGQEDAVAAWEKTFGRGTTCLERAFMAAAEVGRRLEDAIEELRAVGELSAGWDDVLITTAGGNRRHLYLLQQAMA